MRLLESSILPNFPQFHTISTQGPTKGKKQTNKIVSNSGNTKLMKVFK